MLDPIFGQKKGGNVNLSTASTSSFSALLDNVRAERVQREADARAERAARAIQQRWRAGREGRKVRQELVGMDVGVGGDVVQQVRAAVVMRRWKGDEVGRREEVIRGLLVDGGSERLLGPLRDTEGYAVLLGLVYLSAVDMVLRQPTSSGSADVISRLDTLLSPTSYAFLGPQARDAPAKSDIVEVLARNAWVEKLISIVEAIIPLNQPKRKHPILQPLIQLIVAPLRLSPQASTPMYGPLLTLLAIPALPSALPLPAVTYLSTHLPLFSALLPYAASHTDALYTGRLAGVYPQTYLLANLATFGLTGQMLGRAGVSGIMAWTQVVAHLLQGMDEGWGRWVEGIVDELDEPMTGGDSDSEDEDPRDPTHSLPTMPPSRRPRQTKSPLPKNISSKLLLLASPAHLGVVIDTVTSPTAKAPTSPLISLCRLALGLLHAFRGTPKWEVVLEALVTGPAARQLVKRIWREGVRGRWTASAEQGTWDRLQSNPHMPALRILSYIMDHFLLLSPDDEFFSPTVNPLMLDEVLELSTIWRDLAFWGYMSGVASADSPRKGTEEDRNLFTRGVTRLTERNARRKFAPEDHWTMPSLSDLSGFVEAAVLEDAKLFDPNELEDEDEVMDRQRAVRQRLSKRQIAYMSPRLGLLNNLPMSVPFTTRLRVFSELIRADKHRLHADTMRRSSRYYNKAEIRRDRLAEDGFRQMSKLGPYLKGTIQIEFIDKFGEPEAGIDGGGLFKEFLTSLSRDVFDTERGLWLSTDQNELYPNPHSYAVETHQLVWYKFIGQVLGKAMYDGILVDVSFADFFLARWLGRQSYLDDLASLDKDLYKGLIMLKNYAKPEELSLNFTISEEEFGMTRSVDLVAGGSDIAVTAENRHEYIQLVCKYKLDRQIAAQSRAFFNGLSEIIDSKWLRLFDQRELRQVIGGEETPIDVDDLRRYTVVTGFAHDDTVKLFWRVVGRFSQPEKRALLKFVTSCERPPLLGFEQLHPGFGIRSSGSDTTRLPSASSCFNLLKLPEYKDEKTLKNKLLQAINSGAGFDLS